MNSSSSISSGASRSSVAGDEINLLELLDVVLDHRWLIASVTAVAMVAGAAYALLSAPVYRANTVIQVEDGKSDGVSNLLGQASGLFDIRSPASAEMQILRSRLVVGQAVKNLALDVEVTPRYLPIVGRWLAKRGKEPSNPGFLGLGGLVSGNEALEVAKFTVPEGLEGQPFRVRLLDEGYELSSPDGDVLAQGKVGEALTYDINGVAGSLLVASAVGRPGAQFEVTRNLTLQVTEELQRQLGIAEEGKQSGVIRASLEGASPREISRTLNEIGSLYVRQNVQRKAAEAEKSLTFLGTFLPQLKLQMEEAENKFSGFRHRNSTFDLGTEGKLVLEQSVKLQTSLLELQQKRKELLALYTAEHHSIRTLDAQIAAINAELGELNGRVKALPDTEQELLRLTRDVKVNSELYVNLLNAAQQLRLVKEGKVGNVRIVDAAVAPYKPVKPQSSLVVALAAVVGLLIGLALAFLRNSMRPGLNGPADIEEHTGLHVFATVPHSEAQVRKTREAGKSDGGNYVLAITAPQDPAIESLRSLRTALQFAMSDAANNIILITGPTPGIGKSFTSVNLAAILGAVNKKVLLIDADMRKGHLNQYFDLPREKGMSEVLSGSINFADAVHRQVVPNVDFLSTGVLPPNPAELLMAPASPNLVQETAQHYDMIIIDTPPVLAASDTAILAPLAGALFLVARSEFTSLGELQESAKRLLNSGVKATGVIFNGLNMKRRYEYGFGHKYSRYRYMDYKY
ncbi:polysaccharide biosynthesis tyrosine autokinase [Variovorax sp. J2P1-59]|uniref:polysaccharide biosynthesis tyrosine autokinase n=1 Tax=Variovorax flavidus TaxID=3053501 RepID=UPI00257746DF|nr:polysaccharide biosynthesis tyrosine autokinase [Variovorax sp. J2P1-59]MDM0073089.1 polysaccharide biosynthesis tyrosine autokinase [Variovorax sp. J2P1-59]